VLCVDGLLLFVFVGPQYTSKHIERLDPQQITTIRVLLEGESGSRRQKTGGDTLYQQPSTHSGRAESCSTNGSGRDSSDTAVVLGPKMAESGRVKSVFVRATGWFVCRQEGFEEGGAESGDEGRVASGGMGAEACGGLEIGVGMRADISRVPRRATCVLYICTASVVEQQVLYFPFYDSERHAIQIHPVGSFITTQGS
jgi:hypothetical protein